ncbi:hypothetical protein GQ457_17G000740 [Hibiscus cannabinus]
MNLNRQQEDTNEAEIEQRVDQNRSTAGLKVAELDAPMVAGNLEEQPREKKASKEREGVGRRLGDEVNWIHCHPH